MSYDTKKDTITVNDVTYDVVREDDRGHPETTLTLRDFDVEKDDWVYPFPGLSATLGYDEFAEHDSPRDWSNVGTMAVSYRGYNLGDEDISKIDFEIECPHCKGSGENPNGDWVVGIVFPTERLAIGSQEECQEFLDNLPDVASGKYFIEPFACPQCEGNCTVEANPVEYFINEHKARVVIGLFVYEHSGITMSAGPRVGEVIKSGDIRSTGRFMGDDAGWDTSFVGFIYDTPEKVKECIGDDATDEQIEAALRSEVEVYASYLEGDVTCWSVQDDETDFHDACGGYVGDHETCESECFAQLEQAVIKRLAENKERAEWNARDTITK